MTGRILLSLGAAAVRADLSRRLGDAFLDVSEAPDGRGALAMARQEEPGLVIADAAAPGLPALALCRALKQEARLAHVPIVIVADRGARSERLAALEAGADDFLSLPVSDEALLARVRNLLRVKAMVDELRRREETARDLGLPAGLAAEWVRALDGPPARLMLIAPDGPETRRRAAQMSHALRAEIRQAPAGRAALDAAAREAPDLIVVAPGPAEAERAQALRLVSALRAGSAGREAGVVLVAPDEDAAALALDLGANDSVCAPPDMAELAARLRVQLRRKRISDQLRDAVRDGLRMAATDPLTGLYNRRYAEAHLARMMAQCARQEAPMALMMLDLDRFKAINDACGHPAGDAVLREFGARLREAVRGADLVARLGGEEFCVAMIGLGEREARGVAERIRSSVAGAPFPLPDGSTTDVTVSIGLSVARPGKLTAELPEGRRAPAQGLAEEAAPPLRPPRRRGGAETDPAPADAAGLIAAADAALYRSKAAGRDRITVAGEGDTLTQDDARTGKRRGLA